MESMDIFKRKIVDPTIQTSFHTSLMLEFVPFEPQTSIECINEHTSKNLNFFVFIYVYTHTHTHTHTHLRKTENKIKSLCLSSVEHKIRYFYIVVAIQ